MNIINLIGKATTYDKKQQLEVKRPKSWLKSVSAFANGEGGTLVFGSVMTIKWLVLLMQRAMPKE